MFDPRTATWPDYAIIAKARIEAARDELEMPGLDASRSDVLRGVISAWRDLLELGTPAIDAGAEASVGYGLSRT